jgi:hypothetical protein
MFFSGFLPGRRKARQEGEIVPGGYEVDIAEVEEGRTLFLTLQNNRKPEQVIRFILLKSNGHFETEGLTRYFGVNEIRVDSNDVFQSLDEFTEALSFLFETMSEAQDLNLPFSYANEFELHGVKYTLYKEGDFRVLRRSS